jgi:glycosyltransferase involved in cell wall biosynthesis
MEVIRLNRSGLYRSNLHTIAFIGTYVPRRCGIATFTGDLLNALVEEAPDMQFWALAMNDTPEGYRYPARVRFELNYRTLADYRLAAEFLNMNRVEVVCLQHEYGIFGGDHGSYILELLRHLRMPVVTTLHTVLYQPNPSQRAVLEELGRLSDRLVVMSNKAREILQAVYAIPPEKIVLIPHGIPDVPFVDPNYYKDQFGVEGRKVILTFGLVSPGKGLEYMIGAMPQVVRKFPEATYIILGATHPHVRRDQGESYRLSLHRLARELGVEDHLIFHNRFVDLNELCEFLGAADIYVTPYLNKEQIVSGTLSYALGAGKATVSTPYWYAEEMLADGRGRLAAFRNSDELAYHVIDLLENEVERHAMRKRAYMFCREMIWKEVARRYLATFAEVREERIRHPRPAFHAPTLQETPADIPQPKFDHLLRLTDDVGVLQHARFIVPDRAHGYCTDDNARALIAAIWASEIAEDPAPFTNLACRYLSFLNHAFNEAAGRFRNLMGFDRRWLEEVGSDDAHGRAVWSLGVTVGASKFDSLTGTALHLFERSLAALPQLESPRAWAFGLVGIHSYLRRFGGDTEAKRVREKLAGQLFELYQRNAADDWPWIEDIVAYANGKIPHALIVAGRGLEREDMIQAGLRSLDWLVRIQTDPAGHFVPIGNRSWYTRGGVKARFDQQPIEAQAMIEACIEAFHATGQERWLEEARRALEWFLGRNDHRKPLFDYQTGGCCDGLTSDGVNQNQGAESTIALLLSLLSFHLLEKARAGTAASASALSSV